MTETPERDTMLSTLAEWCESWNQGEWAKRLRALSDEVSEARLDGAGMLFMCLGEKANAKDVDANGPNADGSRRSLHAVTLTMNEILHALAETELEIAKPAARASSLGEPVSQEAPHGARMIARDLKRLLDEEAEMFKPGRQHHNGPRRVVLDVEVHRGAQLVAFVEGFASRSAFSGIPRTENEESARIRFGVREVGTAPRRRDKWATRARAELELTRWRENNPSLNYELVEIRTTERALKENPVADAGPYLGCKPCEDDANV